MELRKAENVEGTRMLLEDSGDEVFSSELNHIPPDELYLQAMQF